MCILEAMSNERYPNGCTTPVTSSDLYYSQWDTKPKATEVKDDESDSNAPD